MSAMVIMPSGGVSRYTFLRRHVQGLAHESPQQGQQRTVADEVLALEPIRAQIRRDAGEAGLSFDVDELRRLASPRSFFFGLPPLGFPEEQSVIPWFPVKLTRLDKSGPGANSLTDLLRTTPEPGEPVGVLLQARSGAGKTLACWKAFFDCVYGSSTKAGGMAPPLLAGYVPCRLPHAATSAVAALLAQRQHKSGDQTYQVSGSELLVVSLITVAAGWIDVTNGQGTVDGLAAALRRLATLLRHGPSLLLFVDLNAAGALERLPLAEALSRFQQLWPRHRCIVTYRSVDPDDPTLRILTQRQQFVGYDLQPVYEQQAESYLRMIRRFEDGVRSRTGLPLLGRVVPPGTPAGADPIDLEARLLKRFVRTHAGRTDSLVSTPLLMHWVSQVRLPSDDAELERWNLSDLYRAVVDQQWERERSQSLMPASLSRQQVLTAAVRVALFLLARGASTTRLTLEEFAALLQHPGDDRSWWPADESWWEAQYFVQRFVGSEIPALLEYGVLQREGEQVGFLHDSLIYFFAAMSLREFRGPGQPARSAVLDANWTAVIARQLLLDPVVWQQAAEFLGGDWRPRFATGATAEFRQQQEAQAEERLGELVEAIVTARPRAGNSRLLLNLLRAASPFRSAALTNVLVGMRQHGPFVHARPVHLVQEVYNYLAWCEAIPGPSHRLAERILERIPSDCNAWFRQVSGPATAPNPVMAEHSAGITGIAVYPDGRVATVSYDATVRVWNPASGDDQVMSQHKDGVLSVAVLPDGRVVSGSRDKTVRVWDPSADPHAQSVLVMDQHNAWVGAVAVLPDGRVVSGSWDNTVRVWDPAADPQARDVRVLDQHTGQITTLAVLPDGRVISGSDDHTVRVWDPAADPQAQHVRVMDVGDEVICLAVLPDGRIVSASYDHTIRVWDSAADPQARDVRVMGLHMDFLTSTAVLPDGRVVSGGHDRTVRVWNPATDPQAQYLQVMKHTSMVTALVVLPDGCVVSGSIDCTIRIWDPTADSKVWHVRLMKKFDSPIVSLAVLPDGRIVSSCDDFTLRVWDPAADPWSRQVQVMNQHTSWVSALAILTNGNVVSGSWDNTVRVWDPAADPQAMRVRVLGRHASWITALAVLPNGCIVSGCLDNTVTVWDPSAVPLLKPKWNMGWHAGAVSALAVLPDGRVVSGSGDHTVRVWDPAADPQAQHVRVLDQHTAAVIAVAVLPDGRVVSGSDDHTVRVWDPAADPQARQVQVLDQNTDVGERLAVLPDGRLVYVSRNNDRTVRVWDPVADPQAQMIRVMEQHTQSVWAVSVLPDGRVVSGGADKTLRVWDPEMDVISIVRLSRSVTALAVWQNQTTQIFIGTDQGLLFVLELCGETLSPSASGRLH